ncbi:MAG: C4-dicarboxylate ABC transporter permease [Candidatus Rokuibacteriota bacterium]|nr:MAG: C4-dicarboxylate ABC transporter permease [Candidatus Rokubacteria bacterium]
MRKLDGWVGWAVGGWSAAAALFHIWTAYAGVWEPREMRGVHLLFLIPLAFLLFPGSEKKPSPRITRLDLAWAVASFLACAWVIAHAHELTERWEGVHPVTLTMTIVGTVLVVTVLEAARRSVGFWFFVTTLLFMAYLVASPWLPGFLRSPRAYSYRQLVEMFAFYADEGVMGSLTGISSNILMIFILFASFMLHSGVGQFFMDISIALAGRFRGGPAKVAVVSSGLYGTISGSSVADCYATGTFTIPLMKRIGYRAEIAGAIEACASCGGPLMPPIMGAGAFIMAELTGIPYSKIIVAAALPAVLYYAGIMATVHWEALKHGIGTMKAEMPSAGSLLRRALLFTPFFTIVYFLHAGYSPSKAALYSMFTAIAVSWVAGDSPMTPRKIFATFGEAMRSGVIIASVLAASGLIVAAMSRTGFALAFSSAIINLSGGYVIVALFLVFVVISVLGTGIPTTPAYILAVTVGGASLTNMGIDLLAAHLFVFYYAVLADVTPPVAVTAVAGAQIAGANPMTTGWHATRFGIGGFLAPFLFAFQPPLLWKGTYVEIVVAFVSALVGIAALSAAVAGHMFGPLTWPRTIFLVLVSLAAIGPYLSVSLASSVVLIAYMVWDARTAQKAVGPTLVVTERPIVAETEAPPLT